MWRRRRTYVHFEIRFHDKVPAIMVRTVQHTRASLYGCYYNTSNRKLMTILIACIPLVPTHCIYAVRFQDTRVNVIESIWLRAIGIFVYYISFVRFDVGSTFANLKGFFRYITCSRIYVTIILYKRPRKSYRFPSHC